MGDATSPPEPEETRIPNGQFLIRPWSRALSVTEKADGIYMIILLEIAFMVQCHATLSGYERIIPLGRANS
jgi:hypothetical protein